MQIHSARLGDLYSLMMKELEAVYPDWELISIVQILLSYISGLSRSEIILNKDDELSESKILFLQRAIKRLKDHEPLQYITGQAHFHGYVFKVDQSVLIPRPETEELVRWVLDDHQGKDKLKVLDIGTGSGCIAISLKNQLSDADVAAIDISDEALQVAKFNSKNLSAKIDFRQIDILNKMERRCLPAFDIIVSNPPYVTGEDRKKMLPNVTDHEPVLALFVEDPLIFYREIIDFSEDHLTRGGKLYFETNELYAREVGSLMESAGFTDVMIRKDMQGKERLVLGVKC